MDFLNEHLGLASLWWPELFLRVGLAMLFGLILGLDRDIKDKPVDFRAYMIVAVTSCCVAILGQELYTELSSNGAQFGLDVGKIISGVLTGIGFLGAGAIIKNEDNRVVGTATGASIWAAGGIGLALGFGFYNIAFVAFLAVALILIAGGFVRHKVNGNNEDERV